MKKILIFLLTLLLAGTAMAQSGQDTQQAQQPEQNAQIKPDKQQQTAQANKDQQKKPAADVSDTFTPSEEISEDLAVSFPVDI